MAECYDTLEDFDHIVRHILLNGGIAYNFRQYRTRYPLNVEASRTISRIIVPDTRCSKGIWYNLARKCTRCRNLILSVT